MENLFGILYLIFRTIRFESYYMSHVMEAINPIPLRTILLIILEADEAVYHERHNSTTLTALLKPFFFGFSTSFIFLLIFQNIKIKICQFLLSEFARGDHPTFNLDRGDRREDHLNENIED